MYQVHKHKNTSTLVVEIYIKKTLIFESKPKYIRVFQIGRQRSAPENSG